MTHMINLRERMKMLNVDCDVECFAREIVTFTKCHVIDLNNNSYQIERAIAYTQKNDLFDQIFFVKNDFMMSENAIAVARLLRSSTND